MREKLIQLMEDAKVKALTTIGSLNKGWGAWYADYLLAHDVVALPCKIGDLVFVIPTKENGRKEITLMTCLGFVISKSGNVANCVDEKNKLYQPSFDKFGKTVFLTKEEAEAALEAHNATS